MSSPNDGSRITGARQARRVRVEPPAMARSKCRRHLAQRCSRLPPTNGDSFGPFSSQCRAGNVKIRRGSWTEELFRILEGFPELAHDDEVDACSGALEMLNPQMKSWGFYERTRQQRSNGSKRSSRNTRSLRASPSRDGNQNTPATGSGGTSKERALDDGLGP